MGENLGLKLNLGDEYLLITDDILGENLGLGDIKPSEILGLLTIEGLGFGEAIVEDFLGEGFMEKCLETPGLNLDDGLFGIGELNPIDNFGDAIGDGLGNTVLGDEKIGEGEGTRGILGESLKEGEGDRVGFGETFRLNLGDEYFAIVGVGEKIDDILGENLGLLTIEALGFGEPIVEDFLGEISALGETLGDGIIEKPLEILGLNLGEGLIFGERIGDLTPTDILGDGLGSTLVGNEKLGEADGDGKATTEGLGTLEIIGDGDGEKLGNKIDGEAATFGMALILGDNKTDGCRDTLGEKLGETVELNVGDGLIFGAAGLGETPTEGDTVGKTGDGLFGIGELNPIDNFGDAIGEGLGNAVVGDEKAEIGDENTGEREGDGTRGILGEGLGTMDIFGEGDGLGTSDIIGDGLGNRDVGDEKTGVGEEKIGEGDGDGNTWRHSWRRR